jgi:hypothetical protein
MNDMNSPFGPAVRKLKITLSTLALIRGLPATTGAANRPEVECEVGKIYTTEFPVAAMAPQERTDVRSEVDVIIWDFTGYFGRDAGAIMGGPFSKMGNSRTEQ